MAGTAVASCAGTSAQAGQCKSCDGRAVVILRGELDVTDAAGVAVRLRRASSSITASCSRPAQADPAGQRLELFALRSAAHEVRLLAAAGWCRLPPRAMDVVLGRAIQLPEQRLA